MTYLKFHYLQNEQDWNIPISHSELGYLEKKTNNVQECSKIESSKKNVFNFVKWLNRKNWVCFQVPVERAQTIIIIRLLLLLIQVVNQNRIFLFSYYLTVIWQYEVFYPPDKSTLRVVFNLSRAWYVWLSKFFSLCP